MGNCYRFEQDHLPTCRDNLLCLVKPERLIDGIPYVHNVVFSEFIVAATGHALPIFDINMKREVSNRNSSTSNGDDSDDDGSDNHNCNSSQSNNSSANSHAYWSIVNEVEDGACLLRCVARHVFDNPLLHFVVRHQLLAHMS